MSSRWSVGFLFAYGLVLVVFGIMTAGGGHGTYLLLGLFGSPFSVFGILGATIASTLQWGVLGLAQRNFHLPFQASIAFIVLHYVVAAFLLFGHSSQFADWDVLQRSMRETHVQFVMGLAFYVTGQYFVWRAILPEKLRQDSVLPRE